MIKVYIIYFQSPYTYVISLKIRQNLEGTVLFVSIFKKILSVDLLKKSDLI